MADKSKGTEAKAKAALEEQARVAGAQPETPADPAPVDTKPAPQAEVKNGASTVKGGQQVANPGWLGRFLSSGVFFMLVGALMLWAAYATMADTHTSFTFVLVVVGVAILLYGTGTQSTGQFDSTQTNANYKIAVAGGAGVLAFLVGYGILEKGPEIKNAFQIEKKYFRYVLEPLEDGVSNLGNYVALVDINGEQVATVTRGKNIEIYVPYFDTQRDGTMRGNIELYRVKEAATQMKFAAVPLAISLPDGAITISDGSYEIPRYNGEMMRVSVREKVDVDTAATDVNEAGGRDLPPSSTIEVQ